MSSSIYSKPKIVALKKLNIDLKKIDKRCIEIITKLFEAGFKAYLVGGCIRDLLIGKTPKDFDIVTDAHPEQVNKVFNNSRIIGKRFKIVHIFYRRHIIEVATFRANKKSKQSNKGIIISDNSYGTMGEDVWRRDFTVNALYLDVINKTIIDYVDGLNDIKNKVIRFIGDPVTRYNEDPVRIIRALRFSAKLDFKIDKDTEAPIKKLVHLLNHIPPARLFEEYNKLFLFGNGFEVFNKIREYNVFKILFLQTENIIKKNNDNLKIIEAAIRNTDKRVREGLPIAPGFLLAVFFWPIILEEVESKKTKYARVNKFFDEAFYKIYKKQIETVVIPRRVYTFMYDMLLLQFALIKTKNRKVDKVLKKPMFKAAFDFLLIRAGVEESSSVKRAANWWGKKLEEFSKENENR